MIEIMSTKHRAARAGVCVWDERAARKRWCGGTVGNEADMMLHRQQLRFLLGDALRLLLDLRALAAWWLVCASRNNGTSGWHLKQWYE